MLGDLEPHVELYWAKCDGCGERHSITGLEVKNHIYGHVTCSYCGGVAWSVEKRAQRATRIMATDGMDVTTWAYEREMERFEEALAAWYATPQGTWAVMEAELDRKAAQ